LYKVCRNSLIRRRFTPDRWFLIRNDSGFAASRLLPTELGFVYILLAAIGLVGALTERQWASTIWGWLALVSVSLILFGHYPYQPFRNLLPVVPLASIAVALLYVRVRERVGRSGWVDAVGFIALVWILAVPMVGYAWERLHVVDSRTTAMDWLGVNIGLEDS